MPSNKFLHKFGLLASLYFSQGIPHGLFFTALPVILRAWGVPLEVIGGLAGFSVLWALKFATAPFVDRYYFRKVGPRRSWVLPLQWTTALCLFSMFFWSQVSISWVILATIFVMNLSTSTQDIATDGFAVDLLNKDERGWGNGIQVGTYFLGYILGGGVVVMTYERVGLNNLGLGLGTILILATIPVLLFREGPKQMQAMKAASIRNFFRRDGIKTLLLMLVLFRLGGGLHQVMNRTMFVDLGFEGSTIGIILTFSSLASFLGAMMAGTLANRLGRKGSMVWFSIVRILIVAGFWALSLADMQDKFMLTSLVMLDSAIMAMVNVAAFAHQMDWAQKSQGATDYTLQDSFGVLGMLIASIAGGIIAGQFSYTTNFAVSLVTAIIALVAVWFLFRPSPLVEDS